VTGFEVGFAVMALLVGGAFTVLGWGSWRYNRERAARGVVVPGVVVGEEVRGFGGDGIFGCPVVEFVDLEGHTRRFTHLAGTNVGPTVSGQVLVWYDPADPDERPVVHGEVVMAAFPVIFGVVGSVTVLGTVAGVVLALLS
jgi:hypothetical protein